MPGNYRVELLKPAHFCSHQPDKRSRPTSPLRHPPTAKCTLVAGLRAVSCRRMQPPFGTSKKRRFAHKNFRKTKPMEPLFATPASESKRNQSNPIFGFRGTSGRHRSDACLRLSRDQRYGAASVSPWARALTGAALFSDKSA